MGTLTEERPRFIGVGTSVATVVATAVAVAQAALGQPLGHALAVVGLGLLCVVLALPGVGWAERRPGLAAVRAVLGLYFAATVLTLWVSAGLAALVGMPLISMAVLYLSLRVASAVSALYLLCFGALLVRSHTPLNIVVGSLAGLGAAAAFVMAFSQLARRERYARRDVERLAGQLQQALVQVEELATTRERNRIAREVHDSLGHYLTVANMQLEAALTAKDAAPSRDERIVRVQQLLRDGLSELRRSVSVLRGTEREPQPFARAIQDLVSECGGLGMRAHFTVTGEPRPLPGETGFALYRATQEALTNVKRHAKAQQVEVGLSFETGQVRLRVVDDGVGVAQPNPGNGLSGLRERIELVGGTVRFGGNEGRGFALHIEVPG